MKKYTPRELQDTKALAKKLAMQEQAEDSIRWSGKNRQPQAVSEDTKAEFIWRKDESGKWRKYPIDK